jgi:hypothetical protein
MDVGTEGKGGRRHGGSPEACGLESETREAGRRDRGWEGEMQGEY